MHADRHLQKHPEPLLERALRGELSDAEQETLDRHLEDCVDCAAEIEGGRILRGSLARDARDDALDRLAVEGALARLARPEPLGARVRRWLGGRAFRARPAGLLLVGAAALGIVAIAAMRSSRSSHPTETSVSMPHPLVLQDGSEIRPVDTATAVQVVEQTRTRTIVRLRTGEAQFHVRHDGNRVFRVDAGIVQIEDLGTVFKVSHRGLDAVRVAVSEGRVAVIREVGGERVELAAGDARDFAAEPTTTPEPQVKRSPTLTSPPDLTLSRPASRARPTEDPAALLAAADVARRSHQSEQAVAPLRRLLDRYPRDPRAPSAAFTLGWLLLTDLNRPGEAASAFAQAQRLAPRGPLAEDAAARVAESWQKAGDAIRAARAAREYQQAYPAGRYTTLMRGLLGEH